MIAHHQVDKGQIGITCVLSSLPEFQSCPVLFVTAVVCNIAVDEYAHAVRTCGIGILKHLCEVSVGEIRLRSA